jgi:hypothetical protein
VATLHVSVDDVATCLHDLAHGDHGDAWSQPTLGALHDLHARTGAVISLYAFLRDGASELAHLPDRHREALAAAAAWLRIGFHGLDEDTTYGPDGAATHVARAHYDDFRDAVVRGVGRASVDRFPRVHRFTGRLEVVRAWQAAEHGIVGLLTADDDRADVYHLDARLRERVAREGAAVDEGGLRLVASLPRLEATRDVAGGLDAALARGGGSPLCVFTHEPFLASPVVLARLDAAADWAAYRRVGFAFPADAWAPQASRSRS